MAQNDSAPAAKPTAAKPQPKSTAPAFAPHMPLMSSAFDTQAWLAAA